MGVYAIQYKRTASNRCVADEESSKPVVSAFGFETQELFGNQEESISDGEWSEHEYVSVIFIL